jgi:L-2-hydroxyglutarate oxidase LhgO
MPHIQKTETVIIGAGVVGLAVARQLALGGQQVVLLEREGLIGTQLSSHNSEVIHAGLYYPKGSLKTQTCLRGNALLYDYCRSHNIAHHRCGKLIVANGGQQTALHLLHENAIACGAEGLSLISTRQLTEDEPWLKADLALYSSQTGIIDSRELMASLLCDAEGNGILFCPHHRVQHIHCMPHHFQLAVEVAGEAFPLQCQRLVNAAGLGAAPLIQKMEGFPDNNLPTQRLAKGNYFRLKGKSPTQRLIYPLPEDHGLGIHLTLDMAGQARFGPDVEWVESADFGVDTKRQPSFESAIREYWPGLPDRSLQPDYAGVRPKLKLGEEPITDFLIQDACHHGLNGLINLLGIESPGLTASLALAEEVARRLADN